MRFGDDRSMFEDPEDGPLASPLLSALYGLLAADAWSGTASLREALPWTVAMLRELVPALHPATLRAKVARFPDSEMLSFSRVVLLS